MTPETRHCVKNAGAVSQTLDHKHKLFFLKSSSSIACALKASWFPFCI